MQEGVTGERTGDLIIWRDEATKTKLKGYGMWELPIYMMLGATCGLLGALFNSLNKRLTGFRLSVFRGRSRVWRVLEAVLTIVLVVSLFQWLPVALPQCRGPYDSGISVEGLHVKTHPMCQTPEWLGNAGAASSAAGSGSASSDGMVVGGVSELATLLGQSQHHMLQVGSPSACGPQRVRGMR